jgi:biotin transport system substrate-specific component
MMRHLAKKFVEKQRWKSQTLPRPKEEAGESFDEVSQNSNPHPTLILQTHFVTISAHENEKESSMPAAKAITLSEVAKVRSDVGVVQLFWIITFAFLIAIGAQIQIPHQPVPFTLQTLFVLLAGAMLGPRNGFLSMSLYLGLGLAGLPVFSAGGLGLAKLLGPTGGYLLSFPIAAFLIGWMVGESKNIVRIAASMVVGLLVIFTIGTLQLKAVMSLDWGSAFASGFLIFSWWDILKLSAAVTIYHQFIRNKR